MPLLTSSMFFDEAELFHVITCNHRQVDKRSVPVHACMHECRLLVTPELSAASTVAPSRKSNRHASIMPADAARVRALCSPRGRGYIGMQRRVLAQHVQGTADGVCTCMQTLTNLNLFYFYADYLQSV